MVGVGKAVRRGFGRGFGRGWGGWAEVWAGGLKIPTPLSPPSPPPLVVPPVNSCSCVSISVISGFT